jgi:hypothetical protein
MLEMKPTGQSYIHVQARAPPRVGRSSGKQV